MPAKKHVVTLSKEQRLELERAARSNKRSLRERQRARILLATADGADDAAIASRVGVHLNTVANVRRRFVAAGTKAVRRAAQKRRKARRLDGRAEAHLVALTCTAPPEERKRWSLHLLADRLIAAQVVDTVSHETVRQTLKKNQLKPWRKQGWCIPPQANAEFVAAMEEVLEVDQQPHDAARPQVCLDEAAKQLLGEVRAPLPMRPGSPTRQDSEYKRHGTAALFMVCEPLAGRRHVFVRAQRTRLDFAGVINTLCDELYTSAEKIVLVLDQLNTHGVASLYAAFPPPEALRLAKRLEIHHTPKHGSWLNMAEIELSVLARQCLAERMENQESLARAVVAWEQARNTAVTRIDWRFTTADARIKLKRLYPQPLP